MSRAPWLLLAVLALTATAGCACLKVRKIPLEDRLCGTDAKYEGFRYYLSRPYLVVSQRVCVGQQLVAGKLMENARHEMFLETVDGTGKRTYLDLKGVERTAQAAVDETLTYVRYQSLPPLAPVAPDQGPPAGGGHGGGSVKPPPPAPVVPPKVGDLAATMTTEEQLRKRLADQLLRDTPAPAPAPGKPGAANTACPFQFVMLPDFEEQLAIKDCNFAAKGKYELKFADGWQLRSVGGAWDATEVAVRALQVLGDAVSATGAVRQEQLNKLPVVRSRADLTVRALGAPVYVVRVQGTYIEPGMYRIQKPSEKHAPAAPADAEACAVAGILSDLGLPTVSDVQTYLLSP